MPSPTMQGMTATENGRGWIPSTDEFGARLALIRQRERLNVRRAAERAGVDDSSWLAWETRGAMPRDQVSVATKIARAFGCDLVWLLTGRDDRTVTSRYVPGDVTGRRTGVTRPTHAVHALAPAA